MLCTALSDSLASPAADMQGTVICTIHNLDISANHIAGCPHTCSPLLSLIPGLIVASTMSKGLRAISAKGKYSGHTVACKAAMHSSKCTIKVPLYTLI